MAFDKGFSLQFSKENKISKEIKQKSWVTRGIQMSNANTNST